ATHAVDGAVLRRVGISPNWMARLEERQYNQGLAELGQPGNWRKVIIQGVAIDREAYLASGGLEHAFGGFAKAALAAKLHSQGRRLGYAAGAALQRLNTTQFRLLMRRVLSVSAGEILYRDHAPAELCDRYFGISQEWLERRFGQRDVARALARGVRRRLLRPSYWQEKGRWLRTWLRHCLAVWLGWRPRQWGARLAMRLAMLRCWLERSDAAYSRMYQNMARLGRIQGLQQRNMPVRPALTRPGSFDITALPEDALVGFHALETWQGAKFRWTSPVAALPLALPRGDYEL